MSSKLSVFFVLTCWLANVSLAQTEQKFDLEAWKAGRGARKLLKAWQKENPSPWRSYFSTSSADCTKRWYVNLGPLGVCTRMHDRTWGVFDSVQQTFPKALTDEYGLVWNAFEVIVVKRDSPADGILQPGDLIIAMDGNPLQSAQHTYLGQTLDNRTKRGLEIHAGQIIDAAEGRGEILLHVLRLPGGVKDSAHKNLRRWTTVAKPESNQNELRLSTRLGKSSLCRIRPDSKRKIKAEGLSLRDQHGRMVPIEIPQQRGAGNLVGDMLEIPTGEWVIQGTLTSNRAFDVTIETTNTPRLPSTLLPHLKTVSLKLNRIGTFGRRFDPEGVKARNYAAMLAHRLAVQQEADGSWKAGGYASPAFHTSMCGLALLSTGDAAYDDAVRRAAYYVANHGQHDKWSYSNGTWLIFLAEYFLRTRDQEILPAMRMQVRNLRRFVLSDYTAGHSFAKPGYGGSGWIGGGGAISCGLAVASYTPAMESDDLALLDRMLSRAQEIAPHGRIPYGRSGKVKSQEALPGQGGSCATGPYFIASLIRGGAELFTRNALKRYSTPPFGSAENGHATQTLHFVWACLSVANASAEAHLAHMNSYLWKFTTLREFDGFINKNNYRTEYHNGDGVIGEPYWRTAGYLLIMNADKHNLAITGNPEYRGDPHSMPVVYHRDRAAHNQVLRNWNLVEAVLGDQSPSSLVAVADQLRKLRTGPGLGKDLRDTLVVRAPSIAAEILDLPKSSAGIENAQLAQLLLGHAFQASFSPTVDLSDDSDLGAGASKKELKKAASELKMKIERGLVDSLAHALTIRPVSLIQKDLDALGNEMDIDGALFPISDLSIEVVDQTQKLFKQPIRFQTNLAADSAKQALSASCDFKLADQGELDVRVAYRSSGLEIAYQTQMSIPAPESRGYVPFLTQVPVTGSVIEDYSRSYSTRIILDTGQVIGCEQHGDPIDYLLAGGNYRFWISPNSGGWSHDLRKAEAVDSEYRVAAFTGNGDLDWPSLTDSDAATGISLDENSAFSFQLERPTLITSIYLAVHTANNRPPPHRIEADIDGKWVLMRNGTTTGLMPVMPAATSKVRLTFPGKPKGLLNEVRLVTPAPDAREPALYSW